METQVAIPQLQGLGVVVYDLEIKNPIDGKEVTWTTFDRMGISVGVSFDYRDGDTRIFLDDNMEELVEQLNNADLLVGFHTTGFDNNLLRGAGYNLKPDGELFNYDMLYYSRRSTGWRDGDYYPKNMKLDDHLEAMFGKDSMKTASGAEAPHMYQSGKIGKLISYCVADVKRECRLFEHIWQTSSARTATHGLRTLQHPSGFMRKVANG